MKQRKKQKARPWIQTADFDSPAEQRADLRVGLEQAKTIAGRMYQAMVEFEQIESEALTVPDGKPLWKFMDRVERWIDRNWRDEVNDE